MEKYRSFSTFYPYYLREHSRRGTRIVHFVGTPLGVAVGLYCIARGQAVWVPVILLSTYAVLWASHSIFQGNRPATLHQPVYSFLSDLRMFYDLLTGREKFGGD